MLYNLGPRLRELRIKSGWTQSELGNKLRKANTAISSYENVLQTPTLDTAVSLSEVFGISLDYLVWGEHADVISVKGLTSTQKELLFELIQEFRSLKNSDDLSTHQVELVSKFFQELKLSQ